MMDGGGEKETGEETSARKAKLGKKLLVVKSIHSAVPHKTSYSSRLYLFGLSWGVIIIHDGNAGSAEE